MNMMNMNEMKPNLTVQSSVTTECVPLSQQNYNENDKNNKNNNK